MGSKAQNRLVVFDVEGVIIPKVRFMLFEVVGRIGLSAFIKAVFFGLLYEIGIISVKDAIKSLYKILEGLPLEKFITHFQAVPMMPGVENLFKELKKAQYKTALISSGIPTVALEKLAEKLGADYFSGPEIGLSKGFLTGEVWGDAIEPEGKAAALKRIISDEGLSPCYCIGVADDRNNLPMFQFCDLRIGYNPSFMLRYKSDHVVKGDLSKIAHIIKGERMKGGGHGLSETRIIREAIHTSGFLMSLVSTFLLNRYVVAYLILLVTVVYAISETGRMFGKNLPIITNITLKAAGKSEFQGFVAYPVFYALGIVMSLVMLPEPLGYVSVTVLTLGDGFAAIFGEKFGRTRVPFNKIKSFEGALCGFLSAFLGSLLFVDPLRALIASAAGMFTEILPLPIDDNLTIPLASGLALMAASAFL